MVIAVAALALGGCERGSGSESPSSQQTGVTSPSSQQTAWATPSDHPTESTSPFTANTPMVLSVSLSLLGPGVKTWTVDIANAQAYKVEPGIYSSDQLTDVPTTSAPVPLTAQQVSDFRAMLDTVDIWSWDAWASANRMITPAFNYTLELQTSDGAVTTLLGYPGTINGKVNKPPGWDTFYDTMLSLTGP